MVKNIEDRALAVVEKERGNLVFKNIFLFEETYLQHDKVICLCVVM